MRKTVVSILFLVAFSILGHAQQAFRPHWSVEGQGGVTYTFGEGSFVGMLSPAVSLNVGYHFVAPVEFRLGVGGISGKGYAPALSQYYQYDYVSGQADFLFHSFGHFYTLVGAGVMVGLSNGARLLDTDKVDKDTFRYLWKAPKAFAVGRFGVGYRFPVAKNLAITTEAVYHLLPDNLNSVRTGVPGGNVQVLAGLRFAFGSINKKAEKPKAVTPPAPPKRDYAAEARAAVEARAAAEKAEAERIEAEQAELERLEAERARLEAERRAAEERRLAAEKERQEAEKVRLEAEKERMRAAQQAEEEKQEAEMTAEEYAEALSKAVAAAAGISDVKVYFESNSWTVQSQYEPELQKVASFLIDNTDYSVILTAYCDSRYGTAEYNQQLSERRANAVAKFLKKEGVDASQILFRPAGGIDTYTKGDNVKKNRFVVCEIVK